MILLKKFMEKTKHKWYILILWEMINFVIYLIMEIKHWDANIFISLEIKPAR